MPESEIANLFKKFGKVESCTLVMDKDTGKSKGFGFVEMPNAAEAEAAIAGLHGTIVRKDRIRVKVATEKQKS